MKKIKVNNSAITKTLVFLILPIVVSLVVLYLYRQYYFNSYTINKLILFKDMEFKYFTYDEMDSRVGSLDGDKPFYYRNNSKFLTNSGRDNFNSDTLHKLDSARHIVEVEWNKNNPTRRIVFSVNSAFRSDSRNADEGGKSRSAHKNKNNLGSKAADIQWRKYDQEQRNVMVEALKRVGFNRIGIYSGFIHADNDSTLPNPVNW